MCCDVDKSLKAFACCPPCVNFYPFLRTFNLWILHTHTHHLFLILFYYRSTSLIPHSPPHNYPSPHHFSLLLRLSSHPSLFPSFLLHICSSCLNEVTFLFPSTNHFFTCLSSLCFSGDIIYWCHHCCSIIFVCSSLPGHWPCMFIDTTQCGVLHLAVPCKCFVIILIIIVIIILLF